MQASSKRMKVAAVLKFIRKQLARFWKPKNEPKPPAKEEVQHCDPECTNVQHVSVCEYQQLSEPHLMPPPVKPEHSIKHECRVEDSLGQNVESQEPGAETVHDLRQQLSKVAARGAEVLSRLRDAEEALARRLHKQSLDRLLLIRLEEENARLVAQVNMQERKWQEKFHHLVSLNNVLLREKEQEGLGAGEEGAEDDDQESGETPEDSENLSERTQLIKKISRKYPNHRHKHV
ncbi:hypothetical protein fugu_018382 [Takifugu bimaculatus]|uniref:Uncharacterized protein n=1 Tax=Takifugu bimaculatus TaxID=433685 RepID=A0A4Z2BNZ5_9TELE|nr:hypothetical protein fugu_018382 [Takifugu bimaculatus]